MSPELYTRWRNFASLFRSDSASTVNVSATRLKIVNQSKSASSVERIILTKDAQKKKQSSPNVQTVLGHMLHLTKGVLNTKAGFQATCGEPSIIICRSSRPKYSPTAQNHANVSIYSRTAHQIRSKFGHSNRPATGLLPES